jgi:hypothetical protein
MKHVWTKIMQSKTVNVNILKHDFLKMLAAAIMVGLTFSVIAAAISLILAHTSTAYAGQVSSQVPSALWVSQHGFWVLKHDDDLIASDIDNADTDADTLQASPGHIHLGDGCGSTPIVATERDWQVTIKGDIADIQVMQTFVIQTTYDVDPSIEESGYFGAVLPRGAIYASFRVQTHSHDLYGKYAGDTNWDAEDNNEIAQLKSRGLVRVYEYRHPTGVTHLSSDTMHGLKQGETVVVTYRYSVPVDNIGRNEAAIRLALHDDQLTDEARNSVWINWANAATPLNSTQPKAVINAPRGLNIERTPNGKRIFAASYENIVLTKLAQKNNNQFQLRWAM